MKARTKTIGASIVILAISAFAANADPAEYRQAIHEYNSAMAEVSDALRHYARCISDSQDMMTAQLNSLLLNQHRTILSQRCPTTKASVRRNSLSNPGHFAASW
jgi:hypothetical protein